MNVEILYEDADIFVVVKPPGMPSQGERSASMDMVSYLKNLLARRDRVKNPYVAVVHRLDRPVGGVMVYAKNQKAAAKLSRQLSGQQMDKYYLAVVCAALKVKKGQLRDYLLQDGKTNMSMAVQSLPLPANAKEAVLDYEVLEEIKSEAKDGGSYTLVKVHLLTGRHHQIRVQFAHAGAPLAGDKKYGAASGDDFYELGLFSCALSFDHPASGKKMCFKAKPAAAPFRLFENIFDSDII